MPLIALGPAHTAADDWRQGHTHERPTTFMKGLMLNTLLGLTLGRFGGVWMLCAFVPIVVIELAYGYYEYHLGFWTGFRRGVALLVCGELAFLLGVLMRPMPGET